MCELRMIQVLLVDFFFSPDMPIATGYTHLPNHEPKCV